MTTTFAGERLSIERALPELDPSSIPTEFPGSVAHAVGRDAAATLDIYLTTGPHLREEFPLHTTPGYEAYVLRGLLRRETGRFAIDSAVGKQLVEATLFTSPEGFNHVQRQLGAEPGTDAFMLERIPATGQFSSRAWTEGIARRTILAADTSVWMVAQHDTDPAGHNQAWMLTPPRAVSRMSAQAANVLAGGNSAAIDDFCKQADNLVRYTRIIYNKFLALETASRPNSLLLDLSKLVARAGNVPETAHAYEGLSRRDAPMLRSLGLISIVPSSEEFRNVAAQFAAHTASVFTRLEDITGLPGDTATMHQTRRSMWEGIRNYFLAYDSSDSNS